MTIEKISYVLILFSFLEALYLVKTGKADAHESISNLTNHLIGKFIKIAVIGGYLFWLLQLIKPYAFFHIPNTLSMLPFVILLTDFIYYWNHRFSHTIRLLWSYHSVHHSSYQFNLTTALRLPWFGIFLDGIFYIPAVLVGFDPLQLIIGKSIVLILQYPIHTEMVGKLPVIDLIFNSPSNHRVHHGANPLYIDKNHGGILMIWDHLFGTYQREIEPVKYGLTKPINSYNPFVINFFEPFAILKDVISEKGFRNKFSLIFGKPGWTPTKK